MFLYYKNKTMGYIFEEKVQASNFVKIIKIKNTTMIQLNRI